MYTKELTAHVHIATVVHMQTPQIALHATSVIRASLPQMLGHTIVLYVHQEHLKQIEHNVFHALLATYPVRAPHHAFPVLLDTMKRIQSDVCCVKKGLPLVKRVCYCSQC